MYVMPKIFYLGGGTHKRGVLRAVITVEVLGSLPASNSAFYIGKKFPNIADTDCMVLAEITPNEQTSNWKSGFFKLEGVPANVEESLRAVTQNAEPAVTQPLSAVESETGSPPITWLARAIRLGGNLIQRNPPE
jgi:hypothetical protein